jgi:hypothetical protein
VRLITATLAFLVIFAIVFFLAGWFLSPHLPPTPKAPVTVFELAYWTDNWAGAVLGAVLGGLSARASLKSKPAK